MQDEKIAFSRSADERGNVWDGDVLNLLMRSAGRTGFWLEISSKAAVTSVRETVNECGHCLKPGID